MVATGRESLSSDNSYKECNFDRDILNLYLKKKCHNICIVGGGLNYICYTYASCDKVFPFLLNLRLFEWSRYLALTNIKRNSHESNENQPT